MTQWPQTPEPKFKVGDKVRMKNDDKLVWTVHRAGYDHKAAEYQYSISSGSQNTIAYEGDLKKA